MFLVFSALSVSKQWAVLMAGSRGYNNYRHQADIFHIYDIIKTRGFPKENIITLAYNDVVRHKDNPYPGKIFATADHKNVYPGRENIDYTGQDANAENFFRVLLGDTHNGRALQSTAEDDVFVYYDDHGAPGLLCVPHNNGPEIYADNIASVISQMKKEKKFRNLFFVIEACYSGSVALNITEPNVFIITAASDQQPSYSAQWDSRLHTFRSNEFTQNFLKYILEHPDGRLIDSANAAAERTVHSHVLSFGDMKLAKLPLSTFLLNAEPEEVNNEDSGDSENSVENGASTHVAALEYLQRRLKETTSKEEANAIKGQIEHEVQRRARSDKIFDGITRRIVPNGLPVGTKFVNYIDYDCYRTAIEGFRTYCGEIDENELAKMNIFTHLCERTDKKTILEDIKKECPVIQWDQEELYF
ncbi:Clan CD, family C13, asparaginyl endopeptidase-like cysteine peptidase [Trichomonas vaginalis G3]|uniref:legumain n=1 Tax=Trichomonas vaginalis (strain ATCC PRA-98 / G3) TaxID=412133 RepID=A2G7L6_TRIV3|nr:Clan CD, family C13, legumain-like cysteine peptidase [Trichomonas vaginalis G3]EAX86851.1 Clan CD, family C13, asparaginyl endopeptidase-like cysteine peptidase [Trichomonas vaginalis G3]KAI5511846.1 Clan CD, family C13, legumain-like cysteine peptidase [Trichomonas vaginalis G3]|eukprot:XP_001299781.1 Clan CD, family C13, asparaginyl endopeptidase-like cysteine peptidase [Trichomonas vaginalis G3]